MRENRKKGKKNKLDRVHKERKSGGWGRKKD